MKKNTSSKRQQRPIDKGLYIANERRKGPGGRIKCPDFPNKIEVLQANQAIHESEVEWVEVRRYVRGQKRDRRPKRQKRGRKQGSNNPDKGNAGKKFIEKAKENLENDKKKENGQKESKNQSEKDMPPQQKDRQISQQKSPQSESVQPCSKHQTPQSLSNDCGDSSQSVTNNQQKEKLTQSGYQPSREPLESDSTQSEGDEEEDLNDSQQQQEKQQKNQQNPLKTQGEKKTLTEEQLEKKKRDQEIIVARIVRENKIVYKDKKFVGIMTCERKNKNKKSPQHEPKRQFKSPIEKIINDYYLDIMPIHPRLPKMQFDTQIPENITVLEKYIAKKFPAPFLSDEKTSQEGKKSDRNHKPFSNHQLNQILDQIESIYVVSTFGCWEGNSIFADIHQIIGKTMTIEGECNCYLFEHQLDGFQYDDQTEGGKGKQNQKHGLNKNREAKVQEKYQEKEKAMKTEQQTKKSKNRQYQEKSEPQSRQQQQKKQVTPSTEATAASTALISQIQPSPLHKPYNKMIFTIDPSTSIDLDDALSIEPLSTNGQYLIGIHISDVSQYMKFIHRSQILRRTTSVYLPHRVYHMLPEHIMKISSLNQGVKRLAFSIFVKMNQSGEIIEKEAKVYQDTNSMSGRSSSCTSSYLEKNIIQNRFKLSYDTVQEILEEKMNFGKFSQKYPNCTKGEYQILLGKLSKLSKIAMAHRSKRIKFEVFENKQIKFELNKDQWPIQMSIESRFTSKKVVQEFMIIGNIEAAKHLIMNFRQNALIIYHPKPTELSVKNFNETFKQILGLESEEEADKKQQNIKNQKQEPNKAPKAQEKSKKALEECKGYFEFENIQSVQERFQEIANRTDIPDEIKEFMYFKGRRVQQAAKYQLYHKAMEDIILQNDKKGIITSESIPQLSKIVHFALGQQCYTHFTSPMRRMADILVHESLNKLIYKKDETHKDSKDTKSIGTYNHGAAVSDSQLQKINNGRTHTKRLKRDINEMYLCLMIYKTEKTLHQIGIVTSFGLKSVSIFIPHLDMVKQLMWKDELEVYKVSKNQRDPNILNVDIYRDKYDAQKDIRWEMKKFDKVKVHIDCTRRPPLRLSIELEAQCGKKNKWERIYAVTEK